MQLNKEQVLNFLPHRDPFLFVDSVSDVTLSQAAMEKEQGSLVMRDLINSKVTAHFHCRADHPIFAGHFPGNPILPGVVQVEMIAQVSSFGVLKAFPKAFDEEVNMALLSITEAKFRKPITPGMDLTIITECVKMRGAFMTSSGKIYCQDELISEASVFASIKIG
jgi:3-hydroxyacyl-[acyl-carrier-protein] dehydratase